MLFAGETLLHALISRLVHGICRHSASEDSIRIVCMLTCACRQAVRLLLTIRVVCICAACVINVLCITLHVYAIHALKVERQTPQPGLLQAVRGNQQGGYETLLAGSSPRSRAQLSSASADWGLQSHCTPLPEERRHRLAAVLVSDLPR